MDKTSRFLTHPLFIGFAVLSSYAIAFIYDYLSENQGGDFPFGILYAFWALVILSIIIAVMQYRYSGYKKAQGYIHELGEKNKKNNYDWVVNQEHIARAENNSDEIWVFAQELTFAIMPETQIFKGLAQNLKRGAQYRFYMPDNPHVHKIIADFHRLHDFKGGQVRFFLIPNDEFVFNSIISIYGMAGHETPVAIEFIPNKSVTVWAEMDDFFTAEMIRIGKILADKYPQSTDYSSLRRALDTTGE